MRRWALLLLAASCGTGAGAPGDSGKGPASREVAAERGTLRQRVLLTGEIEAERSDHLVVPMTRIWQLSIRWMADDGKPVKKGDKVIEFDASTFVSELAEKRLRLQQAALDLATQRATGATAVGEKEHEVARQTLLLEKAQLQAHVSRDLMTERDWQERQLELERARVAKSTAETQLASERKAAGLELEVKRIAADKIRRELESAEEGIAALTLTAPRDGILLLAEHPWEGRKMQIGDVLQPGWTVVELPELSDMTVEAHLSDVDDGLVVAGERAACTLDAYPDLVFEGTIREVAPVAQELGRQSLRRAFRAVVTLDRTDPERMRPGMSVKVVVLGPESKDAVLAPRGALRWDGEAPTALLAGGERVPVKLGPCDAYRCVVEDGLTAGQRLRAGGTP